MRLGLLTSSFPRHEDDAAGAFVLEFARALVRRGHTFDVLAPEPRDPPSVSRLPGIEVHFVPYLRPRSLERTFYGGGAPDNLARDPLAWLGVVPFVAALRARARSLAKGWDAIVSHWAVPAGLVAAGLANGKPHLTVTHGGDIHVLARAPLGGVIARRVAAGSSALLFVSESHRDRFLALLPAVLRSEVAGRSHVSPMGIEPPGPPSAPRRTLRRTHGAEGFTVLSLGRLVPQKGVDVLVRAVARSENVSLLIAGDGPERASLETLARSLDARVRFLGFVGGQQKRDLFAAADAIVISSRRGRSGREEGVPHGLLEAMAAGLPAVASDTGGIPSIVEAGNGLLVPPDDLDALATAIVRLRDDADLRRRLGRRAAKTAELYSWEQIAPRIEALLTDSM